METQNKIKAGQSVKVINFNLRGESFIEGWAKVRKIVHTRSDGFVDCMVQFNRDEPLVYRTIDPTDQE